VIPRAEHAHQEMKKKFKASNSALTGLATGWEDKLKRRTSGTSSLAVSASDLEDSMVQYGGVIGDRETDDVERVEMALDSKVPIKAKVGVDGRHFNVEYHYFPYSHDLMFIITRQ
jgi:hypothetical protein